MSENIPLQGLAANADNSEKIVGIFYTEKISHTSINGPSIMRSLWIPSYGVIITFLGHIYRCAKRPFRTIEEQTRFNNLWDPENISCGQVTDPQLQEIFMNKEFVEKACKILAEKEKIKSLERRNQEDLKILIQQIPLV